MIASIGYTGNVKPTDDNYVKQLLNRALSRISMLSNWLQKAD